MIPFVFYYGGQMIEMHPRVSIASYQPQMQFLPLPTQYFLIPPTPCENILSTEKHSASGNSLPPLNLKEQKIKEEQFDEFSPKLQQKPVKRTQNPNRNIYTNLTNLVLNFMVCKKKVGDLLYKIDPTLIQDRLIEFYKYVKEMKAYFCSYFNIQKVKKLIEGTQIPIFNEQFHTIFRIAAKYILEEKIPACLLTSKKLSSLLRTTHFNARRQMLIFLQQVSADKSEY